MAIHYEQGANTTFFRSAFDWSLSVWNQSHRMRVPEHSAHHRLPLLSVSLSLHAHIFNYARHVHSTLTRKSCGTRVFREIRGAFIKHICIRVMCIMGHGPIRRYPLPAPSISYSTLPSARIHALLGC